MSQPQIHEIIDASSLTYHLENTALAIIVWDNHDHVLYWSKRATEIFGWKESEALGRHATDLQLVYHEDQEAVSRTMQEIKEQKVLSNHLINRNNTKSGSVIYCEWYNSSLMDEHGNITNVLSMVQDITERKKAEEALERSEERLSLIYNSAIDPMWLIDIKGENHFVFEGINNAFVTVTGWKKEDVLGFPIEKVMPHSSHELVRAKYNEAIRTGQVIDYVEVAMHPAGQKVGEIRVIPVKDQAGKVIKLVGIANDITEKRLLQKQLDAERDDFNNKVTAAAVKGQEKERSNVSRELHDSVNQVLTTVKLYLELCISGQLPSKDILPKCATLLNETINEIRDLSKKLSAPSLGEIGLKETLQELSETVQATKKVRITLDTSEVACNHIDNDLHLAVYRIAQEQLTNILKHAEAKEVFMKLAVEESFLQLVIRDDGKGFDTSALRKGIGLTNMKSRAQILDGSIQIESSLGEGSSLLASFPIFINEGKCMPVTKNLFE